MCQPINLFSISCNRRTLPRICFSRQSDWNMHSGSSTFEIGHSASYHQRFPIWVQFKILIRHFCQDTWSKSQSTLPGSPLRDHNKRESLTKRKEMESGKQAGTHRCYNDHDHLMYRANVIMSINIIQQHTLYIILSIKFYKYIHLPIQLWDSARRTQRMLTLNTETPLMHWSGQGLSKRKGKMARAVPTFQPTGDENTSQQISTNYKKL